MRKRAALLAMLAWCAVCGAAAQTTAHQPAIAIKDSSKVADHRMGSILPIRDAYGKEHSSGSVQVEVTVGTLGTVTKAKPVAGPKRFYAAALAEAEGWRYRPFLRDGEPVAVRFTEYIDILPPEKLPRHHVPFPPVRDWKTLRIVLARSACFGPCPAYRVEIQGRADGSARVTWKGNSSVLVEGIHHGRLTVGQVRALIATFRQADYFSLAPGYSLNATDAAHYVTSIEFDGHKQSVVDYLGDSVGMPQGVDDVEHAIDRIADTRKWIRGDGNTVPSLAREGWDFKSPESAAMLARAARSAPLLVVKELVEAGAPLDDGRRTSTHFVFGGPPAPPLESAISRDDVAMARFLLGVNEKQETPAQINRGLRLAAGTGDVRMIHLLMQYGADPNNVSTSGTTALMTAAGSGVPAAVSAILQDKPDVNARDHAGKTALMDAAGGDACFADPPVDCAAVIRLLTSAGADPNAQDDKGNTALHRVATGRAAQALVDAGANPNLQNGRGETPLFEVYEESVAKALVKAGANPNILNNKGQTALDVARSGVSSDVVKVLEAAVAASRQ